MTWQKFYEIYDMYGEEQEVWKNYFSSEEPKFEKEQTLDFITWLKKLDLDTIQEGVQNIQRVIGVIGDISTPKEEEKNYTPRPLYKHFDDQMFLDIQFSLRNNPSYIKYLRYNSYWYKILLRNPSEFKNFKNTYKKFEQEEKIYKLSKTLDYLEMLSSIMSTLK